MQCQNQEAEHVLSYDPILFQFIIQFYKSIPIDKLFLPNQFHINELLSSLDYFLISPSLTYFWRSGMKKKNNTSNLFNFVFVRMAKAMKTSVS